MKRLIVASEEFIPSISQTDAAKCIDDIVSAIERSLVTRCPRLSVEVSDVTVRANLLQFTVSLRNCGKYSNDYVFKFNPYDEYFDQSDYVQHLEQTKLKFLDTLLHR